MRQGWRLVGPFGGVPMHSIYFTNLSSWSVRAWPKRCRWNLSRLDVIICFYYTRHYPPALNLFELGVFFPYLISYHVWGTPVPGTWKCFSVCTSVQFGGERVSRSSQPVETHPHEHQGSSHWAGSDPRLNLSWNIWFSTLSTVLPWCHDQ